MAFEARPYLLVNSIQHYAWGTRGAEAFIPRLLGIEAEPGRPYAELWMGAHPKAPSAVVLDGRTVPLPQLLARYPLEILGEAVAQEFSGSWPFLFKVLSAAEALSIQVHPSREQARALHARDPEHYPDSNHKPELVVALDSLRALVGFKSVTAIQRTLEDHPELAAFIGEGVLTRKERQGAGDQSALQPGPARSPQGDGNVPGPESEEEYVRRLCQRLVGRSLSDRQEMVRAVTRLSRRLKAATALNEEEQLFLDLERQYGASDVGLFFVFLLNLVHLDKGEGLFLASGLPHAYLRGNVVECMANSDNVVRLGLTPKFKDAEALLQVLDYRPHPVSVLKGGPGADEFTYRTPASEFELSWRRLGPGQEREEQGGGRPGILLLTKGEVLLTWGGGARRGEQALRPGQSVLLPALLPEFRLRALEAAELFRVRVPGPQTR